MQPRAFDEYATGYRHIRMRREDGILELTLHSEGDEIVWGLEPHAEVARCLDEVGNDRENLVIILTGTAGAFIDRLDLGGGAMDPTSWDRIQTAGSQLVLNHLDVGVPMIAAVNGPATVHAELALLCDIVLAAEHATFRDRPHFRNGVVPGDGAHVVWPLLLGHNRGRYFMLTDQELSAHEAHEIGVVNEVMAAERLLPRAWELARSIAEKPALAVRFTRLAMIEELRRIIGGQLRYGLALEGLAAVDEWPEQLG